MHKTYIFSSKKWKLQPLVHTENYPDNKRRPLLRGGELHSQVVGHYQRTVSTKYTICCCLKLLLVLTGNSRGGQIQRNSTFKCSQRRQYSVNLLQCVERRLSMFLKLEQRSWIKIEVARCRSTQECFQVLREACGDNWWYIIPSFFNTI